MINSKKIVVVMPAYNASETLEKTYNEIPFPLVDEVILVDDHGHLTSHHHNYNYLKQNQKNNH